jgi:hypothetical protein
MASWAILDGRWKGRTLHGCTRCAATAMAHFVHLKGKCQGQPTGHGKWVAKKLQEGRHPNGKDKVTLIQRIQRRQLSRVGTQAAAQRISRQAGGNEAKDLTLTNPQGGGGQEVASSQCPTGGTGHPRPSVPRGRPSARRPSPPGMTLSAQMPRR